MTGHTHSFSYVQDTATVVDRKRDKMAQIITHHVTTGHYLEYEGSYAEDIGLHAKPCGSSIVTLSHSDSGKPVNKKVTVEFLD